MLNWLAFDADFAENMDQISGLAIETGVRLKETLLMVNMLTLQQHKHFRVLDFVFF
jgi:hypothetical protein